MILHDELAKLYIEGGDLAPFRETWYFADSDLSREYEKNVFTLPPADREGREQASQVYTSLLSVLQSFSVPGSSAAELYDGLFPHWLETLKRVSVDLIVGLPYPHDAVVCSAPDGKLHILLDVVRWTYMLGYDLEGNARGILAHELFHVLLRERWPEEAESSDYLSSLDHITFHEGFAHMVQFCAMHTADWHSEKLTQVGADSRAKLAQALAETDPEKQKAYLSEADRGCWYSKYAAMAGMLFLADRWEDGGIPALRAILETGPAGFAPRCL